MTLRLESPSANRTAAVGFDRYKKYIDSLFCRRRVEWNARQSAHRKRPSPPSRPESVGWTAQKNFPASTPG